MMTITIIAFMLFQKIQVEKIRNATWSTEKAPSRGPMVVYIKDNGEQENKMEPESLVEDTGWLGYIGGMKYYPVI